MRKDPRKPRAFKPQSFALEGRNAVSSLIRGRSARRREGSGTGQIRRVGRRPHLVLPCDEPTIHVFKTVVVTVTDAWLPEAANSESGVVATQYGTHTFNFGTSGTTSQDEADEDRLLWDSNPGIDSITAQVTFADGAQSTKTVHAGVEAPLLKSLSVTSSPSGAISSNQGDVELRQAPTPVQGRLLNNVYGAVVSVATIDTTKLNLGSFPTSKPSASNAR